MNFPVLCGCIVMMVLRVSWFKLSLRVNLSHHRGNEQHVLPSYMSLFVSSSIHPSIHICGFNLLFEYQYFRIGSYRSPKRNAAFPHNKMQYSLCSSLLTSVDLIHCFSVPIVADKAYPTQQMTD